MTARDLLALDLAIVERDAEGAIDESREISILISESLEASGIHTESFPSRLWADSVFISRGGANAEFQVTLSRANDDIAVMVQKHAARVTITVSDVRNAYVRGRCLAYLLWQFSLALLPSGGSHLSPSTLLFRKLVSETPLSPDVVASLRDQFLTDEEYDSRLGDFLPAPPSAPVRLYPGTHLGLTPRLAGSLRDYQTNDDAWQRGGTLHPQPGWGWPSSILIKGEDGRLEATLPASRGLLDDLLVGVSLIDAWQSYHSVRYFKIPSSDGRSLQPLNILLYASAHDVVLWNSRSKEWSKEAPPEVSEWGSREEVDREVAEKLARTKFGCQLPTEDEMAGILLRPHRGLHELNHRVHNDPGFLTALQAIGGVQSFDVALLFDDEDTLIPGRPGLEIMIYADHWNDETKRVVSTLVGEIPHKMRIYSMVVGKN